MFVMMFLLSWLIVESNLVTSGTVYPGVVNDLLLPFVAVISEF